MRNFVLRFVQMVGIRGLREKLKLVVQALRLEIGVHGHHHEGILRLPEDAALRFRDADHFVRSAVHL